MSDSFADPMDYSLSSSPVHGISQARILECIAISFSKELPNTRIKPPSPVLAGGFFITEPPGKPILRWTQMILKNALGTKYYLSKSIFGMGCSWALMIYLLGKVCVEKLGQMIWEKVLRLKLDGL